MYEHYREQELVRRSKSLWVQLRLTEARLKKTPCAKTEAFYKALKRAYDTNERMLNRKEVL